ncbi:MAG: hypothetical protein DDT32_01253 [Syntrophomonadaceae bacterium]|nr:hypothetical protein [Bacillota bacterium]
MSRLKVSMSLLLTALLVVSIVAMGCPPPRVEPVGVEPVVPWPPALILATASVGGAYYIYGGGMASILTELIPGVVVSIEATGGPVHNMALIQAGYVQLGLVTMGPAWKAWHGEGPWPGGDIKHDRIRALFPMYNSFVFAWAPTHLGITSIADLAYVDRMGVGPAGGTPGTYWPLFFKLWGFDTKPVFGGHSALASQQIDGLLGVVSNIVGVPTAAVKEVAARMSIVKFGIDGDFARQVMDRYPFFTPATIPAFTYEWMDYEVETLGMFNFAVACKYLPECLVYEIVKAIMENNPRMLAVHPAAAETLPKNIWQNTFLPFHPGAIRYFKEIGIKIDPRLYPPEYKP